MLFYTKLSSHCLYMTAFYEKNHAMQLFYTKFTISFSVCEIIPIVSNVFSSDVLVDCRDC